MTARLPLDVEQSLHDLLAPNETVLGSVTLAGTLVLTSRRIFIFREGRSWRIRTGIRSWWISPNIQFAYASPRGGMGRLVIGPRRAAVSFFVKESDWEDALRLIGLAHAIAHGRAADTQPEQGKMGGRPQRRR
jgi:hypothetical protein